MKNRSNLFFLIAACVIVLSYAYYSFFIKSSDKNEVQAKLEAILGSQVSIADSAYIGADGTYFSLESVRYPLMIEYYDNDVCTSCSERGFSKWKEMLSEVDSSKYTFVLIFHSRINEYEPFFDMIRNIGINCKCYKDLDGRFLADNPVLSTSDKFYYAFLLNRKKEIEVAGLPLYNNKLWQLYKNQINTVD